MLLNTFPHLGGGRNTKRNHIKSHIEAATKGKPPILHIVEQYDSFTYTTTLCLTKDMIFEINHLQIDKEDSAQSSTCFAEALKNLEMSPCYGCIRDTLILGAIHEAYLKTGLQVNDLLQDAEILSQFVQDSLQYYDYLHYDIPVDIKRLYHLFQVREENFEEMDTLSNMVLIGELPSENATFYHGILGVSKSAICFEMPSGKKYKIDFSKAFALEELSLPIETTLALSFLMMKQINLYTKDNYWRHSHEYSHISSYKILHRINAFACNAEIRFVNFSDFIPCYKQALKFVLARNSKQ